MQKIDIAWNNACTAACAAVAWHETSHAYRPYITAWSRASRSSSPDTHRSASVKYETVTAGL